MGFSSTRTYDFIMLSVKLKELPKVKAKLESGELGYRAARVLAPIVDRAYEDGWLKFALNHSRRDLEQEVKRARKEAADNFAGQPSLIAVPISRSAAVVPARVHMEMSPTQFARYDKLWEQIRKQGDAPADKVAALLEIMATYVSQDSPRGEPRAAANPPVQIHVHQCPDCAKATVPTAKGELELGEAEIEHIQCDCQISRPGQRNTTTIQPVPRRKVLAQFRHKCQRPGCNPPKFLEVHYRITRSQGGSNDPHNLVCLCSGCLRLVHDNKAVSWVKSPTVVYAWRSGPTETQCEVGVGAIAQ